MLTAVSMMSLVVPGIGETIAADRLPQIAYKKPLMKLIIKYTGLYKLYPKWFVTWPF